MPVADQTLDIRGEVTLVAILKRWYLPVIACDAPATEGRTASAWLQEVAGAGFAIGKVGGYFFACLNVALGGTA